MLCREFPGHLPSELWLEWLRLPFGTLERIVEYRAYVAAKAAYEHDKSTEGLSALAQEFEFELAAEDLKQASSHG